MLSGVWGWSIDPAGQSEGGGHGHWPIRGQSDDEDAFWWRVNIGAICYWAAHWRAAVSLLQCCRHRLMSTACAAQQPIRGQYPGHVTHIDQSEATIDNCAACCSPCEDCGTLINTGDLWWTRNICPEMSESLWCPEPGCLKASRWRQQRHRCRGLTSNGDHLQGGGRMLLPCLYGPSADCQKEWKYTNIEI